MIIGICGWIGSGKDTIADYLTNFHGFRRESFASSLKDAVSAVFGWDRTLLEGRTKEAREWREKVDSWWAARLNIPNLTPRWVLQYWGTEVCRTGFHTDIWIASLENKLRNAKDHIVISDCRFPNEVESIKNAGGQVIWVRRGTLPEWYDLALTNKDSMPLVYPDIHASEWAWVGTKFGYVLDNNGSIQDLYNQIENLLKTEEALFVRRVVLDLV
jgi:hypothetical protein